METISNKKIKEMQTMAQLNEKETQLAALISEVCTWPAELTAKFKNLFSGALEKMLEAEMDRQTRTDDIETRVLAMYDKGMSIWDI